MSAARWLWRMATFPLFLAALILAWQQAIGWFHVPAYILQRPSDIVLSAVADIPRLLDYTLVTATETLLGFFVACVLGVPMGLGIVMSGLARRTIYPLLVSLEMVPKIAFAPLFIAWLGFGLLPKIIVVFLVCFFPVVLNAIAGFSSLSEELTRFGAAAGATAWRRFIKLRLPAALPQCFVGFKFAAINATVGATIAEFIGSDRGLGFYIQIQTGNMRPDLAFAAIFLLTLLGLALFGAVTLVERFTIPGTSPNAARAFNPEQEPIHGRDSRALRQSRREAGLADPGVHRRGVLPGRRRAGVREHQSATGETIGVVAQCGLADVDRAVAAARRAFDDGAWSRAAPEHRKSVLLKLAGLIRDHAEELATLECLDSGKTITDCLNEIGNEVPNFFQWYAELIDKSFGKVAPTGETALALIVKEPIGVVGLVLPWNFPLLMAAWKLAPALAAGCCCILKPAEQTPLTAIRLAALAAEAGVPPGVLSVLPGDGATGRAIGLHNDIDAVSFTGSTEVGALFLHYAADSNMKTIGLEMGGKSPLIVLDDAVLDDDAISSIVMAACWNGGQNCSANMRQIVAKSRREEFVAKVKARMEALIVGNPFDPATEIGAMVTAEHRSRVMGYIDRGKAEGARLLLGGSVFADMPGFFVQPTLFDGVTPDMTIAREEIFGPVLGVLECASPEEALRLAADSAFGLHATIFTQNLNRAVSIARRLPCGTVAVNKFSEGDIKTPFGGYRKSGSLARDNGTEAIEQYLQTKTIWFEIAPVA